MNHILVIILVAPFTLLWSELFVRVLLPQSLDSQMNIFASDPIVGFTHSPNGKAYEKGREYNALYEINSLGLRDREYSPKKENVFRVLLIGDSFSVSHGLPIEDSLSRQLERELQRVVVSDGIPITIEVINTAHGGYSSYNYWKAYLKWASVFKPDVVFIGLSPDDYDCSNEGSQFLIEDGMTLATYKDNQIPQKSGGNSIRKLRHWLSWNSEFYILMRNFLYYSDLGGRISLWMNAKGKEQNIQLKQFLVPQPKGMKEAWAKTFYYLKKLHEEATTDGVPMIVMPIPLKLEIDSEKLRQTLSSSDIAVNQIDVNQPLKEISAFCKANKIAVLDPRQALRERHAEEPCYFIYDGHWIGEGIRVAVASIVLQWRRLGLSPWGNDYSGQ